MKGNANSSKVLNESAKIWLQKAMQVLTVKEYGKGSVRNYLQELTLLFKYYNQLAVEQLRQDHIEGYLIFIKENHRVDRAKCKSVAQACSFFFKKVMPVPYIVPSNLYPQTLLEHLRQYYLEAFKPQSHLFTSKQNHHAVHMRGMQCHAKSGFPIQAVYSSYPSSFQLAVRGEYLYATKAGQR